MRVVGYKLYPYALPLARPLAVREFQATVREGTLVLVQTAGGAMGWGDVAPLPGVSTETLSQAVTALRAELDPLMDQELRAPDVLQRPPIACGSAAFGLDSALLDAMAAEAEIPLRWIYADHAPATVALNALLDGDSAAAVRTARAAVDAGYRSLKFKVGRHDPVDEAQTVRRIREEVGDTISLRLDANRAWSLAEADGFLGALGGTSIEYIEEPLRDPGELHRLSAPIALDESLSEPGWEELGAMAVVIKPSVQDGIAGTLRMADKAKSLGLLPVVSSLFESGIGLRSLAALAAGIAGPDTAHGLDTLGWFAFDVARTSPQIFSGRMEADLDTMVLLNQQALRPMSPPATSADA